VQHPTTKRWAILDDDGTSAWLTVTEPDVPRPVGDCFVYNCRMPEANLPSSQDRSGPPPITTRFASELAHRPNVSSERVRVAWTARGDAAVVLLDDEPVALLVVGEKNGYSRGIAVDGPYGHPWDEARFEEVFREQLDG
jgi:hypothetical protein